MTEELELIMINKPALMIEGFGVHRWGERAHIFVLMWLKLFTSVLSAAALEHLLVLAS